MRIEASCLNETEIKTIHQSAMEILRETGVKMILPAALEVLDGAGAKVDLSTSTVKFDAELVEKCLAQVPNRCDLYGRGSRKVLHVPEEGPFFGSWANSIRILDPATGERRPATSKDMIEFVHLVDALPNYDWMQPLITPQDVPPETAHLHAWAIALQNTGKHLFGQAAGVAGTKAVLEMCAAIAGSMKLLREQPFISLGVLTRPPLMWSNEAVGGLIEAAKNGIPCCLGAGPIAGATGPVTMAGTLAQAHAELLSGIVLAQVVSPGAPMFYNSSSRVMDMATGNVTFSGPEWFLFKISLRQLGRHIGVPIYTAGMITDAKIPDAQSGYEKAINGVAGTLGGDLISGCTLDTNKTIDMGDLVMGDEIASMMKRVMRGFEVTPETLAVKVIDQVGPGGEYLATRHTLKHFRHELWRPSISDRSSWNSWVENGRKDAWQRAKERARKLLAEHEPYQLPPEQQGEIRRIVDRADAAVI